MTMAPDFAARPGPGEHAPYYGSYVSLVGDGSILDTLTTNGVATDAFLRAIPEARGTHRYAEGKWSIRQAIGHMIDAERVFAYRAMAFARGDETHLPAFDENAWAANGFAGDRTLASLAMEFAAVRQATSVLFGSMNAAEWERSGTASIARMSVRAAAWVIAGHERHHVGILTSRYL